MRRAILVTTGTVVGMASVIAYNPSQRLAATGLTVTSLTPASATTPTAAQTTAAPATATPTATPTQSAAAPSSNPASPAATRRTRKHKRPATTKAATAKATKRAKPAATAASTPKPAAPTSGPFANADGTYHSASQQVLSHGRYYGDATIAVTVHAGHITDIQFNETGGNFQFADAVQQYLVPEIIKQQVVAVGIVSGATGSSMALINGLNSVLKKA